MSRKVGLMARYDGAALRPPTPMEPPSPAEWAALQPWRHWCLAGAVPRMNLPWAVAALDLAGEDAQRLAARLCLERDGSWQLAACQGAAGRIALRLKTKAQDWMPWRPRQPDDAWDSGYLIPTAAGLQALAQFQPRRATLIVAQGLQPAVLLAATESLAARQRCFAAPVRLLVVR